MKYTGDGRSILAAVKADISKAGTEMEVNAAYDHLPVEHRQRIRSERTTAIRSARDEGRRALMTWAEETREAATKRLNKIDRSVAEETRRMAEELKISRLVDSARANGNVRGTVEDLENRSADLYSAGNRSEARIQAQAAMELAPMSAHLAHEIVLNIEADEILEDPSRAAAARELADVDVVTSVFERDTAAATSKAFQQSAALARALGESVGVSQAMQEASAEGRFAKIAAYAEAQRTGSTYQEPEGVVHGLALGLDYRGVPQPEGAHLPEPVR